MAARSPFAGLLECGNKIALAEGLFEQGKEAANCIPIERKTAGEEPSHVLEVFGPSREELAHDQVLGRDHRYGVAVNLDTARAR